MTHGKNRVFDPFEFDASPFAPIGGMRALPGMAGANGYKPV